jgi:Tfp pilus assembly protein PilN
VAAALDGEELEQAIALEAETYSGISAFESRLGMKRLPEDVSGESRWWVTQIAQSDWHDVDQTVRRFGGRLGGLGHAALPALPESLLDDPSGERQAWRLHQCFGEATISLKGHSFRGQSPRNRQWQVDDVIALGDLSTQRTQSQLLDWCEETATVEESLAWITDQPLRDVPVNSSADAGAVLSLSDAEVPSVSADATTGLFGDAALRVWAETMAAALREDREGRISGLPVAVAAKPPMSQRTAALVACGFGVLAVLGCFALYSLGNSQLTELNARIGDLDAQTKKLAADKQALQRSQKTLEERLRELVGLQNRTRRIAGDLDRAERVRQFQQTRWLKLVSALAEAIEGDCWVRGLHTNGKRVTVQGMAVSQRDIARFASNLERHTGPHGWRVHPAQTRPNEWALIEFEVGLDVSDQVIADSSKTQWSDIDRDGSAPLTYTAQSPSRSAPATSGNDR